MSARHAEQRSATVTRFCLLNFPVRLTKTAPLRAARPPWELISLFWPLDTTPSAFPPKSLNSPLLTRGGFFLRSLTPNGCSALRTCSLSLSLLPLRMSSSAPKGLFPKHYQVLPLQWVTALQPLTLNSCNSTLRGCPYPPFERRGNGVTERSGNSPKIPQSGLELRPPCDWILCPANKISQPWYY